MAERSRFTSRQEYETWKRTGSQNGQPASSPLGTPASNYQHGGSLPRAQTPTDGTPGPRRPGRAAGPRMNFFDRQDQAHRNTKTLVVCFLLAVACIVGTVYLAFVLFLGFTYRTSVSFWNSDIFSFSSVGTLAVIAFGSLYKISVLSRGGRVVAESLGGRLISPATADPPERKLLNVVEEMSIASGVPMPKVYVMDAESGINAFAAGHTTDDAVISVTRGCLHSLDRAELQGVIGHEFSHILNGDMRLNTRLMGMIFGILCIASIGRILLRARGRRNPLPPLGLALVVIGGLGVFFGRLIQSAVSRQREFLGDASSVQFTRNPAGLSHALQKIGAVGSHMESEHAADACHMFFANGLGNSLLRLFATHPPLEERIRAIDPEWDGTFPLPRDVPVLRESGEPAATQSAHLVPNLSTASATSPVPTVVHAQAVMPHLGQPTPLHLRYAEALRDSFPDSVRAATRNPTSAVALIYGMVLSGEEATRTPQLDGLRRRTSATICDRVSALLPDLVSIAHRARLPLVNITLPALRETPPREYPEFKSTLKWLIESDEHIDLFELALQKILLRNLDAHFTPRKPPVAQFYSLKALFPEAAVLFSALAHTSSTDDAEVTKAFRTGVPYLRAREGELMLLAPLHCGLPEVDAALSRFALAVPQIKRDILEGCVRIVGADGVIQEREAELLRAIAEALDCPIPPFVEVKEQ